MPVSRVLIADDQPHIRESLCLLLEPEDYEVLGVAEPKAVLATLESERVNLVLMDMNYAQDTTSGVEGLELIRQIRERDPLLPIIVMTAWANIELSVAAMQSGANDFIEKPWNNNRLLSLIANQIELAEERETNQRLSELARPTACKDKLIAHSTSMQPVMRLIERTASSDANILLTGESGVGKSLFASLIHSLSRRSQNPLVQVNMGALSDTLFESELFGHQKGAFTDAKTQRIGRFELADKGTLFLDEIANIPKPLQGKLLRVLESGEFESLGSSRTRRADVRIISASNVDFEEEVAAGNFRQDLLYRLNTITIEIPPLRQRVEDIEPLAQAFLVELKAKYRRPELNFSDEALKRLKTFSWPGNVRELAHSIERAVLMANTDLIRADDLGLSAPERGSALADMTLEQAERMLISRALEQTDGNVIMAAEKLGISRSAFYRRLEKYGDIALRHTQD
ncbi:MAG: sigma-54 dependent transcriptional regulator [Pseudomonadota bacterium]